VKGTPTVVYIWASYCLPCRDEVPLLVAAHARVGDRIQFVGIDDRDARESAIRFLHTFGVDYPNLFDPSGALAVDYGLIGPPGAFFYGADGTLVASVPGQLSAQDLADHLAQIDPGSP
jgi:cytochrome c biogenesis protein CcmG/thiol:disulfide interchange protein DsbE